MIPKIFVCSVHGIDPYENEKECSGLGCCNKLAPFISLESLTKVIEDKITNFETYIESIPQDRDYERYELYDLYKSCRHRISELKSLLTLIGEKDE